ncbi:hypothetical protein Tco_0699454 [Tanacetum coccineum]
MFRFKQDLKIPDLFCKFINLNGGFLGGKCVADKQHGGFTLALLDSLFSKGLRTVKSIPLKCHLGFSWVLKEALDKVICTPDDIFCRVSILVMPLCLLKTFHSRSNLECKSAIKRQRQEENIVNAIRSWGLPGGSLQVMRENLAESSPPLSEVDEEDINLGERNINDAPYKDVTLEDLKTKHTFKPPPSLPHISIDHHHLVASLAVVLDRIKSFPHGTSCGRDGLRVQHILDCLSGADVAIFDELVSYITQVVNLFLDGKCPNMLGEYISSAPLTPLVKLGGIRLIVVGTVWRRLVYKVSAIMIGHSLDGCLDSLQFGVRVAEGSEAILHFVNRFIEACGDDVDLSMLLVDFKNAFNLVDRKVILREVHLRCPAILRDPFGPLLFSLVLHPLICKIRDSFSLFLHAWYLDDGTIVGDTVVVGKILELTMKDRPGCGLHLNVDKTEVFLPKEDPRSRHAERIVTASGLGFDSDGLQTKLLRHTDIVSPGHIFDDALSVFNTYMETDLLSNPSKIAASKLMKKMVDIYFTRVTKNLLSTFSLSPRQMALWTSQREDHTSDWLRTVPISGLGQTMNCKTYRCVLYYWLGISLFFVSKPCSACSRVFVGDIYGDHAVSCAGIIGIKHRHNAVRDTLVDTCYCSGISDDKEVDIGLNDECDKPLRPADMLLYSWDGGLDVCVDLTGSSPLTQTEMVDFVPGRAVIDVAQRKRGKYMTKCAAIGYGFLPFSFSSLGELETNAVILLKRIRKFSMTQDIGARADVHIFNRNSFAIAKGVGAQVVSWLPSNLL